MAGNQPETIKWTPKKYIHDLFSRFNNKAISSSSCLTSTASPALETPKKRWLGPRHHKKDNKGPDSLVPPSTAVSSPSTSPMALHASTAVPVPELSESTPAGESISPSIETPEISSSISVPIAGDASSSQEQVLRKKKRAFGWTDGLYSIELILEMGKGIGEVAGIASGPLKAACSITQAFVKATREVLQTREEIKELEKRLNQQVSFLEQQERKLRYSPLSLTRFAKLGMYDSLQEYALDLRDIGLEIDQLGTSGSGPIGFLKGAVMVRSLQDSVNGWLHRLDESFRRLTVSIEALTAAHTSELVARDVLNKLLISVPEKRHDSCLPNTRTVIRGEIRQWADNPESRPIFALVDQAGTGKSTIANTMVQEWFKEGRLGARFYFTKPSVVNATKLASSLSRGISDNVPRVRQRIVAAIEARSDFVNDPVSTQLENLLFVPLKESRNELSKALEEVRREKEHKSGLEHLERRPRYMTDNIKVEQAEKAYLDTLGKARMSCRRESERSTLEEAYMAYLEAIDVALNKVIEHPPIIVIDALDECIREDRSIILQALLNSFSDARYYKLLITCRPESDIHNEIQKNEKVVCHPAYPLLSHANYPDQDIEIYATKHLADILDSPQVSQFVKHAKGLFIWASTARGYLDAARPSKARVRNRFNTLVAANSGGSTVYNLYRDILFHSMPEDENEVEILRKLLQVIAVAREMLTLNAIDELLGLSGGGEESVIGSLAADLRSVLSDGAHGSPIYPLHPTFIEFLQSGQQPEKLRFSHDESELLLANGCMKSLKTGLKYDICNIARPHNLTPSNKQIADLQERLTTNTTPGLRYSAMHVLSHVSRCLANESVVTQMRGFFQEQLLYWIELMSLLGKIYPLIQSVQSVKVHIQKMIQTTDRRLRETRKQRQNQSSLTLNQEDVQRCNELIRMMQLFQHAIEESAMQIYCSALPFVPADSTIGKSYYTRHERRIPKVIRGTCKLNDQSTVLAGHKDVITCIAFSPDGSKIASGSRDWTVRLWDAMTGAAAGLPLGGHTSYINCLAFSPDGSKIASGSGDQTVRLWDAVTGAAAGPPLEGHTNYIRCLAFSPDGNRIASGSDDQTVRLWDVTTVAAAGPPLKGHTNRIRCIAFSPDGTKIASGSDDRTMRLWDVVTGAAAGPPLEGHTGYIRCLAFLPDSSRIASGSDDQTVRLWDVVNGVAASPPLVGHTGHILCLACSPDGSRIASGSRDRTVRLWDVMTGAAAGPPLEGHTGYINCLVFSPDGSKIASGSDDQTVRLWDTVTGVVTGPPLEGHTDYIRCLAFSPDGNKIASGSGDRTVHLWDLVIGVVADPPLESHTGYIRCLAFSPDGSRIASGSGDWTVRLWDALTGVAASPPLEGHTDWVRCLAFSPDGSRIVSGSDDKTVRLWDAVTGVAAGSPLEGHTDWVRCLAFSPDGTRIASGSDDHTVCLWDAVTGLAAGPPLKGHISYISCLAFSPDGSRIASGSGDRTVHLWDVATGTAAGTPIQHGKIIYSCSFYAQDDKLFLIVNNGTIYNIAASSTPFFTSYIQPITSLFSISKSISYPEMYGWTEVQGTKYHLQFILPSNVHIVQWSTCNGKIAYALQEFSIVIVDCTHL